MLVLIDNGHGENTPGKRSPKWADGSQLFEWQYAREVANAVYNQLIAKGVDCELLVKESVDVPLAERARRANEAAAKHGKSKTILVSIHVNASNGKGTGWEIHTYPGKQKPIILRRSSGTPQKKCSVMTGRSVVTGAMGTVIGKAISTFSENHLPGCTYRKLLHG